MTLIQRESNSIAVVSSRWPMIPLKRVFRIVNGGTPKSTVDENWNGEICWATPEDLGNLKSAVLGDTRRKLTASGYAACGTTLMPAGSLLLSSRAPIGYLAIAGVPICTNQGCKGLVPRFDDDSRFYYYALLSAKSELQSRGQGATFQELSYDNLATVPVPRPAFEQQRSIADFLDRETARIDDLIRDQERLLALLQESRRTLIAGVVCRGLDPSANFKQSGIWWLGPMPRHWQALPVKRLFRLVVEPAPDNHDYELLSIYTEIGVRPRKELEQRGNKASTTDGYFKVKKGDFIVNKLLAWMGAIGLSHYDGVTSPAYDILRPVREMEPRYYDYLFGCGVCFTEFRRHSRGIMDMRLRLYFEDFGPLFMPYPPLREQQRIVEYLESKTCSIDRLVAKSQRSIDLLQEYRTALITAAVTGQIDVRNHKPQGVASCQ